MMNIDIRSVKKWIFISIWLVMLIHFLKDITQDILGIATPLDKLGDIQENISRFPMWFEWFWHWAMVSTFIGEFILILLLPKYIFRLISKTEKYVIIGFLIYIPLMFLWAYLLS